MSEHDYETENACLDEVLVKVEESDLMTLLGTLDRLRRQNTELQTRGTELLERARAYEAMQASTANRLRDIADGLHTSFMHRGQVERRLRRLADELEGP